jgi:hypothetical protein
MIRWFQPRRRDLLRLGGPGGLRRSILPTSLGVDPCYTIHALGRCIAHKIVEEIDA